MYILNFHSETGAGVGSVGIPKTCTHHASETSHHWWDTVTVLESCFILVFTKKPTKAQSGGRREEIYPIAPYSAQILKFVAENQHVLGCPFEQPLCGRCYSGCCTGVNREQMSSAFTHLPQKKNPKRELHKTCMRGWKPSHCKFQCFVLNRDGVWPVPRLLSLIASLIEIK